MKTIQLTITPKGAFLQNQSLEDRWQQLKSEFSKVKYIIFSELRIKIFDKTLGMFFLMLEPILMAFVYYFLVMVLKGQTTSRAEFLSIYVAVVFWRWFSRTMDSSPALFSGYGSILKQTNYPVYSIVFSFIGVEMVNLFFGVTVLTLFLAALGYFPGSAFFALPLVLLAQLSLMICLSVIFSIIGAFFKDLQGILYAFIGVWFYLSPGIYPVEMIPEKYRAVYQLNPFAHLLPAYRGILLENKVPDLGALLVILVTFSALSAIAFRGLRKARYYFFSYL